MPGVVVPLGVKMNVLLFFLRELQPPGRLRASRLVCTNAVGLEDKQLGDRRAGGLSSPCFLGVVVCFSGAGEEVLGSQLVTNYNCLLFVFFAINFALSN